MSKKELTEAQKRNLAKGKRFSSSDGSASENGRKGSYARSEAIKRKKSLSALTAAMLNANLTGDNKEKLKAQFGIEDDDVTYSSAIVAKQISEAMKGDARAFSNVSSLLQREEEKQEQEEKERLARMHEIYHMDLDMVPDAFHSTIRDIRRERHREYVFKGGRGSTKSSTIAQTIVELLKNNHDIHALACRKVGNTIKDSVYAKIKWAIAKQHLEADFEYFKSPVEIVLTATKQRIYFRGADEPEKIKSITPEFGYIGVLWLEELDQFAGPEEVRNIEQSAIRGGDKAWIFKSFNPPKTKSNWANKYILVPKPSRVVHHSTYMDVEEDWLGRPFIEEAEHLKEVNPPAYEHEYIGVPNGEGGTVFDNIIIRTITDEEVAEFDHIFQGVDWGLNPDPFAFVRLHYDAEREEIYFLDEIYQRHLFNDDSAQMIIDRGYDDFPMTCDSAEKKSVADFRTMGLNATGAAKGPGSVEYGMKWLMHRKIIIDPARTPEIYREFVNYEYDRDRQGNVISGYPDRDNHTIDATRYALERYCNRRDTSA